MHNLSDQKYGSRPTRDDVEVHVSQVERIKRNPQGATTESPKDTKSC